MSDERKPVYEQALGTLRDAADSALRHFPELESLAVAIVWKGHFRELPTGFIITDGGNMTAERLAYVCEQSLRLHNQASRRLEQVMVERSKALEQKEKDREPQQ